MKARSSAVVEAAGVLGELHCEPPLTLRQVRSDEAGTCELRLVGTAAGPLAGDDLELVLRVQAEARAVVRATGASIAQGGGRGGGPGRAATVAMRAELDAGASLTMDPGPLIVCADSRVEVSVDLALGPGTTLEWRELIVLGRTGEPPGAATLRWDVTRADRPVLRQFVDLTDPALTAWAGMTARRRVLACALITAPTLAAATIVAGPTAVAQRIDAHTVLVTVLGDDTAAAARQLDELCLRTRRAGGTGC